MSFKHSSKSYIILNSETDIILIYNLGSVSVGRASTFSVKVLFPWSNNVYAKVSMSIVCVLYVGRSSLSAKVLFARSLPVFPCEKK